MKITELLGEDDGERAVSPVIGVILMVAITVILAAVIGTFVLGLGDQVQQTAPNSNMAFDYSPDPDGTGDAELDVSHNGGDGIASEELFLVNAGTSFGDDTTGDHTQLNSDCTDCSWFTTNDKVKAGDTATLDEAGSFDSTADVRVVWRGPNEQSSTLRTWDGQ